MFPIPISPSRRRSLPVRLWVSVHGDLELTEQCAANTRRLNPHLGSRQTRWGLRLTATLPVEAVLPEQFLRSSCSSRLLSSREGPMFYPNVLTPDRIPEFFIPPKFAPQQNPAAALRRSAPAVNAAGVEQAPGCWGELCRGLVPVGGHTEGDGTDWDPKSRAALSLPHFPQARTPYGFCRLLESPHTRRKESLFHGHRGWVPSSSVSAPGHPSSQPTSAPESSPPSRQRLPRALSGCTFLRALGRGKLLGSKARKDGCAGSSPDPGPRAGQGAGAGPSTPAKESTAALGGGGTLRLRAEYCSERQRLRLRLLSLEGLYEQCADCHTIRCRLSLHLEPGKAQKQRSAVIRRSRNPIFNEDFFFDLTSREQLHSKVLKIKVVNKVSSMKRDAVLGVCQLHLASILPV